MRVEYNTKYFGLPKACNFIKKETLVQVFSSGTGEFCEISKNTFLTAHLATASQTSFI